VQPQSLAEIRRGVGAGAEVASDPGVHLGDIEDLDSAGRLGNPALPVRDRQLLPRTADAVGAQEMQLAHLLSSRGRARERRRIAVGAGDGAWSPPDAHAE
jgi:hypothetical protein